MNIGFLKKINGKLPDAIKILFGTFIRMGLTQNKVFKKQYSELIEADSLSRDELQNKQITQLKDLLIFAYENTKYYKEIFNDVGFEPYTFQNINQLSIVPLLTREILEERFDDIQTESITNYYKVTTGGTTGKPIKLLLEKDSIYKERAFVYHFWSKYGYNYKKSRLATFRGTEFEGKLFKYNPLYNEMLCNPFLLNEEVLGQYVKKINSFGAEFIYGYPSAVFNFCRLLKKCNFSLSNKITAVLLISENVYDYQREFIENVLKCKTYSFYGHSERAVFAEQDGFGYKFNPLYGYTEFENIELRRVICSGFLNRKMPLIRYALDDYAESKGDGVFNIMGHHDKEVLIGKNDERISSAAINFHCDALKHVLAYQFVQTEKGKVDFKIQAINELSADDFHNIKDALDEKIGNVLEYEIQKVHSMELTKMGKYKMIIQKMKIE